MSDSLRTGTAAEQRRSDLTETAAYLHELLVRPGKYRTLWEQRVDRPSELSINEAAVARVLAEYLWESGERPDTDTDLPRRLRDRVSRALTASSLSAETLRWFVKAFAIDQRTAHHLMNLRTGAWRDNEWW